MPLSLQSPSTAEALSLKIEAVWPSKACPALPNYILLLADFNQVKTWGVLLFYIIFSKVSDREIAGWIMIVFICDFECDICDRTWAEALIIAL